MAGPTTSSKRTTRRGQDVGDALLQFNTLVGDLATLLAANVGTGNVTVVTPTIGTTVTIAVPASVIQINGVRTLVAALTAQALGALGTIPASTWGIITMERVASGAASFVSGAANYTTGYATAALALAAIPAVTAGKVRVGYVLILASASTFVVGTDALAGGSGGNPATTTTYGAGDTSLYDPTLYAAAKIGDQNGTAISSTTQ